MKSRIVNYVVNPQNYEGFVKTYQMYRGKPTSQNGAVYVTGNTEEDVLEKANKIVRSGGAAWKSYSQGPDTWVNIEIKKL